ncbi:hypothetical protein ACFQL7_20675 [Halocatena marina]|uniref:Uncharacterized protein n=1 Tax=Halocatena marina TaxID=2934937 RepID=A0ABD5YS14_9EURY|nr:hypothetical protein [Halocatena marina]
MSTTESVLEENLNTHREKNDDYGDWRIPGRTLALWAQELDADPVDLTDKHNAVSIGLYTRRLDKIIRAFNGEFAKDEMNFESIEDSHADESNYAAMHAALHNNE